MKLTVKPVPTSAIHQVWPQVREFLAEALKWGEDDYTEDQAKALLANGSWVLLVVVDDENGIHGAVSVNLFNMPNDRVAFITAIGGTLISNQDTHAQLCALLKGFGATKIQGAARESVARLWRRYGFKERYVIVEAKI